MQVLLYSSIMFYTLGLFMIMSNYMNYAAFSTGKLVKIMYGKDKRVYKIDAILDELSGRLAKLVRLDTYKKKRLLTTLKVAGINHSPEHYIATAWIKTAIPLLFGLLTLFITPILLPIFVVISIRTYFKESRVADKELQKEKKNIEYELPRFTREIAQELKATRDVLSILDRYKNTAGDSLKRELIVTLADMKSGNYETALTRFETRIQSPMLSEVIRGLISVIRGDDATVFFQLLAHDFKTLEIQRLKSEANKRPNKLKKYSFLMLGCMLLLYMVIIGIATIQGLGGMF
ncbi:MAG: secretion protein F [Firmicutes bacterium HGW-Firmicutes-7]|nr:MAG: secretion protein F [Firmicutes bacterium HGW-Firmicutes-7]